MLKEIDGMVKSYEQGRLSRRQLISALTALAILPSGAVSSSTKTPVFQAKSLNHVSLAVSDIERSTDFYSRVGHH